MQVMVENDAAGVPKRPLNPFRKLAGFLLLCAIGQYVLAEFAWNSAAASHAIDLGGATALSGAFLRSIFYVAGSCAAALLHICQVLGRQRQTE